MHTSVPLITCTLFIVPGLLFAQTPHATLTEAQNKLKTHDLNGAAGLVRKAILANPRSPELFLTLGQIDYLRGDFAAAEMDFKSALRLNDNLGRAWLGLGKVFEAASLGEKAKVSYRNAYREDPADPDVQRYYARTLRPPERLAALEAFLDNPGPAVDSDTIDSVRRQAAGLKWLGVRQALALASPVEHAEVKLSYVTPRPNVVDGYSVPVSFNGGKTLHLLLDSGAGGIVVNPKAAAVAGLAKIAGLKFWGIGDQGDKTGYAAFAESVRIGNISFTDCPVVVSDKNFVRDEDGLIGTDVFSRFLITLDFQKMVVKLDPLPARKTFGQDPDWLDAETAPELSGFTRFWRVGKDILLTTAVNGAAPVLFLIDTGSSSSLIDPDYARQFTGIYSEDRVQMKGVSGRVAKVESTSRLTFQFGRYRQPVPQVLAVPLAKISRDSPRITGIFGITTLHNFRLRIDYRDGLIDLEYVGPKY